MTKGTETCKAAREATERTEACKEAGEGAEGAEAGKAAGEAAQWIVLYLYYSEFSLLTVFPAFLSC